ncbi:CG4815, partial [Drosophila busckii]
MFSQLKQLILVLLLPMLMAEELANDTEHTSEKIEPRIYGGARTTITKLGGYAVQICQQTKLICTGTLISTKHVVTSAHCVENKSYRMYHVVSGETKHRSKLRTIAKLNYIADARLHPDYNKFNFIADIAVLKVTHPIRSVYVGYLPICKSKLAAKDVVTIAGWGETEHTDDSLRTLTVPVIDKKECEDKVKFDLPDNVICAGSYNSKTVCNGDSGGPLVFKGQLCGVSTWTYECGNRQQPDIFMSTYAYKDFIKKCVEQM